MHGGPVTSICKIKNFMEDRIRRPCTGIFPILYEIRAYLVGTYLLGSIPKTLDYSKVEMNNDQTSRPIRYSSDTSAL